MYCQENRKNEVDKLNSIEFVQSNTSEFLVPPVSILNNSHFRVNYQKKIREILLDGIAEHFDIKYVSMPSFELENALVISDRDIYYNITKEHIWGTYYKELVDTTGKVRLKRKKVKVEKYRNKISKKDAILLKKLYRSAISKTRYLVYTPEQLKWIESGLDGTNYSFSLKNNGKMEGTTWSPKKGSKMFRLVEIHKSLIQVLLDSKQKSEIVLPNDLITKINNLILDINK